MDTSATTSSIFGATPLEDKADELAVLLRAGLDDDFARQVQRAARGMNEKQAEALVALINMRLSRGSRMSNLKLVVSRRSDEETTITVIDRSRMFGSGWSVARQTFAV